MRPAGRLDVLAWKGQAEGRIITSARLGRARSKAARNEDGFRQRRRNEAPVDIFSSPVRGSGDLEENCRTMDSKEESYEPAI
jgi:hypothetical protein